MELLGVINAVGALALLFILILMLGPGKHAARGKIVFVTFLLGVAVDRLVMFLF